MTNGIPTPQFSGSANRHNLIALLLVAIVLLAPSIWMLATIPPLWRDADAYHQVAASPARSTAGGHGLLYGLAVRPPLYAGYQIERWRGTAAANTDSFFRAPQLTDTGILLLISAQHLALCAAAFALIVTAVKRAWMRVALAAFFASNSIFYTFAQCVGSESLSMICVLVFATLGLSIVQRPSLTSKELWTSLAAPLLAALLSRHVNTLLILILPLTFLFAAMAGRSAQNLRQAATALAVGLACLLLARCSAQAICATEKLHLYSKIGFTFLWRVGFVQKLPATQRTALLDRIAARAKTEEGHQALAIFREIIEENIPLQPEPISQRLRAALFPPGTKVVARRVHGALNDVAVAFLLPPTPEHWQAAQHDFAEARKGRLPSVSRFLFLMTCYYWDHPNDLQQCGQLSTFRNYTPEKLIAIPAEKPYFHLWQPLSLNGLLVIAAGVALALLLGPGRGDGARLVLCAYLVALVGVGLAMVEITALIGDIIPRYTLPLWELLWIACLIGAGALADASASFRFSTQDLKRRSAPNAATRE